MWDRPAPAERVARLRRDVRERRGASTNAQPEPGPPTLADAQLLIARLHGFENWADLVSSQRE
jgi:hypothetical protein